MIKQGIFFLNGQIICILYNFIFYDDKVVIKYVVRIICDEKLKKLTKSKAIGSKALLGFVRDCMEPL